MSAQTLAAIEDAVAAHIADEYEEPWLVTHWYAIACASDVDMQHTNYVHMAADAPLHTSLGLIRLADARLIRLIDSDE